MTRLLDSTDDPVLFAGQAGCYLRRLGYRLEPGVGGWLYACHVKSRRRNMTAALVGRRIMARIYREAGWPPNLDPSRPRPAGIACR